MLTYLDINMLAFLRTYANVHANAYANGNKNAKIFRHKYA